MSYAPLVEPADELTIDEVRRYSRHLIIPDVGMTGQKRLKNAKVLVIGAGGLGSPALLYLAAAGVGTLGIAEFDEVDESNLQRQVIHGQSDIGKSKALSAKESIAETNPYVEVVLHEERLDNDNVMQVFEGYDLIVDGTDNFATRYMVNDAAYFLGIPYVWGSIYRFDGQASVFAPSLGDDAPCYRCLYPEPPPPGMVPSCAEGGVLGVLCARDRLDPGQRGDQAAHRHRRPGRRQAGHLRRPRARVAQAQGPQGPQLRAVRRERHGHRADRLRRLLRGASPTRRPTPRPARRSRSSTSSTCSRSATRAPATSCWSTCASPTSTRSTRSPARC